MSRKAVGTTIPPSLDEAVPLGEVFAATFIEQLEALARSLAAESVEIMLVVDSTTLAQRLAARGARPDRPEHHVNNRWVGPDDAGHLVASIDAVLQQRPHARLVDASKNLGHTIHRVRAAIHSHNDAP